MSAPTLEWTLMVPNRPGSARKLGTLSQIAKDDNPRRRRDTLFITIMGDIHFWIPLIVLLAGLLLLRELH